MRSVLLSLLTAWLLMTGPGTALAEEVLAKVPLPPGTLSSAELFELFNNKTVFSVTAVLQRASLSYYDPNGEVRQRRNDITRTGRWRVTDNDRICLQMEELPEKCRIIVKEDGIYKKYIVRKDGVHQHSVSYPEFREGNPFGL